MWIHPTQTLIYPEFLFLEHVSRVLFTSSGLSTDHGLHVADTDNNTAVKNYIVSTLRSLQWHVEEDSFTDDTPYGPKRFTNVIATKDPTASLRVILSAHFDSKFFPTYPQNQVRMRLQQSRSALTFISL